jgi:ABC-2 type transport system permease protein
MKLSRVLSIAKKNLRSLRHDRRTFAFIFIVPFIMMLVFGYAFGGEVKNIKVYIVNLDEGNPTGSLSWQVIDRLNSSETFNIEKIYTSKDAALDPANLSLQKVRNAEIWASIEFGKNFTNESFRNFVLLAHSQTIVPINITLHLDGTNPNVAQAVTASVAGALRELMTEKYGMNQPVSITTDMVYGKDTKFIDFFAPGIMGLAGLLITFMLTIVTFVRERSTHTLERLMTTPATEGEIVTGYAMSFGLLALAQSSVILVTGVLLFNIQIEGSFVIALLVIFLLGVGSMGMGLLLSSVAKNELQAVQFIPLVFIPSILLAGIFWPLEAVPEFLRPLSYFIPLTYAVDGARSVMIRGWGINQIWMQLSFLAVFAVIMLILSTLMLKRRK